MPKILLVDDDDIFRTTLKKVLSEGGYDVTTACDGVEALSLCSEIDFQLIITDIIMPELDGFELIQKVAKFSPTPKVIAISGGGQIDAEMYLTHMKHFQVQATLKKPFKYSELLDLVAEVL